MKTNTLMKLAAAVCCAGGLLRIFNAFLSPEVAYIVRESLYFATDFSLLFAVVGIFFVQNIRLGWPGLLGFIFALTGLGLIFGPDDLKPAVSIYSIGVTLIGVGHLFLSVGIARSPQVFGRFVPSCWLLSTVLGAVSLYFSAEKSLFTLSGVFFGLGYIIAGIRLWRHQKSIW